MKYSRYIFALALLFLLLRPTQAAMTDSVQPIYNYQWVSQSDYPNISQSDEVNLSLKIRNTGNQTWYKQNQYPLHLGTARSLDRPSAFKYSSWLSDNRPAAMQEDQVDPGETATFEFTIKFDNSQTDTLSQCYQEYFTPVIENLTWMPDQGIYWNICVHLDASSVYSLKQYPVTKIIDGDTIKVEYDDNIESIRLIGIDTPEIANSGIPEQCFATEATLEITELIKDNNVVLISDPNLPDRDIYHRLLRYVYLPDGTNINLELVKRGAAYEFTYNQVYNQQLDFKQAQDTARQHQAGLWHPQKCNGIKYPQADPDSFQCDCSKTCDLIDTCQEAYFQFTECGCIYRDADNDRIPCEKLCLN
ncbi:thermonuclease family protein [Patescibacteria group bacterium]|nr:thermonuclease family protein [Patescibacteria group bacterium]